MSRYSLNIDVFEECSERERSLFDSHSRRSGAIFDTAEDASRSDSVMTEEYLHDVVELEHELIKKKRMLDAAILAVCKCKKSQVLSNVSLGMAKALNKDFTENGFAGEQVRDFLRLVKERFFLQQDADIYKSLADNTEHVADDVECVFMSFGGGISREGNYDVRASHIALEFRNKKAKKHFWLQIPLKANTHFGQGNFEDVLLGKYVLSADIIEKEKNRNFGKLKFDTTEDKDGKSFTEVSEEPEFVETVRRKNIAADFSAARFSKQLFKYLTTSDLDKSEIMNWHRFKPSIVNSYEPFYDGYDLYEGIPDEM